MKRIALLALLLAACTTPGRWEKPGATEEEFFMDRGECQARAMSVTTPTMLQQAILFRGCMEGRGWRLR